MEDLSLHILDIAENSIAAGARNIEIAITENKEKDGLLIEIIDDGKGMDEELKQRALDPFFTTKPGKKVGLGLPLLAQACREAEGSLEINSKPGAGTTIRAKMRLNHIDRKPLGDIGSSITALICRSPEINLLFKYYHNGEEILLDTKSIGEELGEEALCLPEVLLAVKKTINEAIYKATKNAANTKRGVEK